MAAVSLSTRAAGGRFNPNNGQIGDLTLVATDVSIQSINMYLPYSNVYLPNAATLAMGTSYTFRATGYAFMVRTCNGNALCQVMGGSVTYYLSDNTTVDGVWSCGTTTNGTTTLVGPILNNASGDAATNYNVSLAALTSTRGIVAYRAASSGTYAQLLDVANKSVSLAGARVQVSSATPTSTGMTMLTSTKAMCAYTNASQYLAARILDISGSTITPATEAVVNAAATGAINLVMLTSTKAMCVYSGTSSYLQAVILDVSTSTITPAAVATINAEYVGTIKASALSATKVICAYTTATAAYAIILDVSGSTITPATPVTIAGQSTSSFTVAALTSTKAMCSYSSNWGPCFGIILDVSGSTITPATPITWKQFTGNYGPAMIALTTIKFMHLATYADTATPSVAVGDVNTSTPIITSYSNVTPIGIANYICLVPLTSSTALAAWSMNTQWVLQSCILEAGYASPTY